MDNEIIINSMEKKFWHELTDKEVQESINKGITYKEMDDIYKTPDWCKYEHPFCKEFHWCDDLLNPDTRPQISVEYCNNCKFFKGN